MPQENKFGNDMGALETAVKTANEWAANGEYEIWLDVRLCPESMGQVLMYHTASTLNADIEGFTTEDKIYWTQVAGHMGPDWIARLRKIAAFMERVESFK